MSSANEGKTIKIRSSVIDHQKAGRIKLNHIGKDSSMLDALQGPAPEPARMKKITQTIKGPIPGGGRHPGPVPR